jgi:mRNA-degrading endonuclease RelE of RelBE toxin-antitoxin system
MDHVEKLFRKVSKNDREKFLFVITKLVAKETRGLNIKKLVGSDFYRLRKGNFRIIFHYDKGITIVDSIRIKGDTTYAEF